MPQADAIIKNFVTYMRNDFPKKRPWVDSWGTHYAPDIRSAMATLAKLDPIQYRVLHYYTTSTMSRVRIAQLLNMDYATVKRYLDLAVKCLLNLLIQREIMEAVEKQITTVEGRY